MIHNYSSKSFSGYIALTSSLVLATLLAIVAFAANRDVFLAHAVLTDEKSYRQALYAGESCVDLAMHMLSVDIYRFTDGTAVIIPITSNTTCTIETAVVSGASASVGVSGHSGDSFVFLTASGGRIGSGSSVHFVTTHIQRKRTLSTP